MVDMGKANYVIGIEIFRDRSRGVLGLSQKGYIDRVLERFNMQSCSSGIAPILKGDKLSKIIFIINLPTPSRVNIFITV